jgi:dihydrofolate synthase/folylpolyglutamate synthase
VSDALSYLFGLGQFGVKFGLDSMRTIVERLGHPERSFQSIHIAGTNGKGSVTAMIDRALREAGHRSARYTSPHLVDLNERFVIDGRPVSTDSMTAAVADVRRVVEELLTEGGLKAHPTFFEVTTAVAFELFRRAGVETAVLEVGLGGRLDATNVVSPLVTAITSIAYDHQQHLGSTLAEIAREKAGIIKPRVPVVVGEVGLEALTSIREIAAERGAPMVLAADDVKIMTPGDTSVIRLRTPARDYGNVTVGLRGAHQIRNAVVAVRVLELIDSQGVAVSPDAVRMGVATPSWPGRLDLRRLPDGREILFDAAHNPAGAAALASYLLEGDGERRPLVFAGMHDKDLEGMLRALLPVVGPVVITRASNRRSADPEVVADLIHTIAPTAVVSIAPTPLNALDAAWRASQRIIVAGSIFLVGDVLKLAQQGMIGFENSV